MRLRYASRPNYFKRFLLLLLILAVVFSVFYFFNLYKGSDDTKIEIFLENDAIGKETKNLLCFVESPNSIIKNITIQIVSKNNKTIDLVDENFNKSQKIKSIKKEIEILPDDLKIEDGVGQIKVKITNHPFLYILKRRAQTLNKQIIIDRKMPYVEVLSKRQAVSIGGTGLVIYRVSEEGTKDGVYVNDKFFPGYSGYFQNKRIHLCFFSIDYKLKKEDIKSIYIAVEDQAKNIGRSVFSMHVYENQRKEDEIKISDDFLLWKLPAIDLDKIQGKKQTLLDRFLLVNNEVRKLNNEKIINITTNNIEKKKYWEGPFLRLHGSVTKSFFADYRSYIYKEKVIDHQYHLGVDFASYKKSDVKAANSGKIVFVGDIGIYGKTVIIDHGFSVFSLYSHLTEILIKEGDIVEKNQLIGKTGTTGFAGGDHLHFAIIIHDTFVDPLEWINKNWIRDNIEGRLNYVLKKERTFYN